MMKTTIPLRYRSVTRAAAALLSITMLCTFGDSEAANVDKARPVKKSAAPAKQPSEAPKPLAKSEAAKPAATPEPADVEGPEDHRLANTELGRAVAEVRKDPKKAAKDLDALRAKMPWLDDVIVYYAAVARSRFDREQARRDLEKFLSDNQDSVLRGDAAAELASVVAADGDRDRAVAVAERYGRSGPDTSEAASVCFSTGSLLATKDPQEAVVYLQCARSKAPLSDSARSAYELLTTLRREHPEFRPSGAQGLMDEARLLAREGRSEEQAAVLGALLDEYPGSTVEAEAELAYGRNLGRSGSKAAGAEFFEKKAAASVGIRKAKLLYEAATLRWNNDQNQEATVLFDKMLGMHTGIGDEQQALYALARINDIDEHPAEAISYYGRAAALAKGVTRAESQWRQGWVSYRAKDYEAAARSFASMAASAPRGSDTDGRADALYWQGRSLEHLGRKEEARDCYRQVLAEFPLGYYAAASERQLGHRTPATTEVTQPVIPANMPPAAALAIRRATTLRESGLVTLAARDLSLRLSGFDAETRRAVLPALPSSGAYDAAFRIAIEMNDSGELTREEARPYFYPRAHSDVVEREAKKAGIDPLLVYALMRQESAFSTTAVSSAKALGLMQLLEKTARRVAAASGLPQPDADDLFDPAINIRIAVRYLAELAKQFDGNTALMAAAYNAGETAAERWKELAKKFEQDEMIEQISYRETRLYVKSILRNMRNYRSIYGSSPVGSQGSTPEAPVAKAE